MEFFFPSLFALAVGWLLFDFFTRDGRAAKELDRQFRALESQATSTIDPKPLLPGFKFHPSYDKWEKEALKLGFTKLGEIYTGHPADGPIRDVATRVMADTARTTLLAFSRMIAGGRIIEQTEMENWCGDGTFLYSTNNPLVYHLKSPDGIRLNKVVGNELPKFVASHNRFMQECGIGTLKDYRDIETVIAGMAIQSTMRKAFARTKEFPIEEEEANRMSHMANVARNRKIYARLRELRKTGPG